MRIKIVIIALIVLSFVAYGLMSMTIVKKRTGLILGLQWGYDERMVNGNGKSKEIWNFYKNM